MTTINPFSTTDPILSRPDGTYVVQYNGHPYHVCAKTEDPYNLFDLTEVETFAKANPSLVSPDTSNLTIDEKAAQGLVTLAAYQDYAYGQIDSKVQDKLASGFTYSGQTIPCDSTSQANLTSEITAMVAGIVTYPVIWDLGGGNSLSLADQASLMAFAQAMKSFIQTTYANGVTTKAAIKSATTAAGVQTAYQGF